MSNTKNFIISETEVQKIGAVLAEIPAKFSIEAIDILRNLPPDLLIDYPAKNNAEENVA